MEPTVLIFFVAFLLGLIGVILTIILFIQSIIRIRKGVDYPMSLILTIFAIILPIPTYALLTYGYGQLSGLLAVFLFIISLSLLFFRTKAFSFALSSLAILSIISFIVLFSGLIKPLTLQIEIIKDVSALQTPAFYISFFLSMLVLFFSAISMKLLPNKISQKNYYYLFGFLVLVLVSGILVDSLNYRKFLKGNNSNYEISNAKQVILFERGGSLWISDNLGNKPTKIYETTKMVFSAKVSSDNNYIAFVLNKDDYAGYSYEIKEAYIMNLKTGKLSRLAIPELSDLRAWDFSDSNKLLMHISSKTSVNGEPKYKTYIFDSAGNVLNSFAGTFSGISFVGEEIFMVRRADIDYISNQDTVVEKLSEDNRPIPVAQSPVSMIYGGDQMKFDQKNRKLILQSAKEDKVYIINLINGVISDVGIKKHATGFSADGEFYTVSNIKSQKTFIFSTIDPNYKMIIPTKNSVKWLNSGKQFLYESKDGIVLADVNGRYQKLTSSSDDKIFKLDF